MLMYYLTQEAVIKFFEISTYQLLIIIISNLDFHKTSMFLIKSTSEIMMIKKSIKINIFKISVYLDPLMKFFISPVEINFKNRYFQTFRFILNPFNREDFFMKYTFEIFTKIETNWKERPTDSKFWFTSVYFNREVF